MSESSTLNSRLRVLVAKTFRAEKLYSSMKNSSVGDISESSRVSELANYVRADVWQCAHTKLRKGLNDILAGTKKVEVLDRIEELTIHFESIANNSKRLLAKVKVALADMVQRDEYAHAMKLSLELVRIKAQMQANQIIADELTSVIQSSRHGETKPVDTNDFSFEEANGLMDEKPSSKVIPFKRRAILGK